MKKTVSMPEAPKGRVLAIDTGSTSTKVGYFVDGKSIFEENIKHDADTLASFRHVMDEDALRRDQVGEFLRGRNIHSKDIDIVMARAGLFAPVVRYPGEDELASLAENGYDILSGKVEIRHYGKNAEKT